MIIDEARAKNIKIHTKNLSKKDNEKLHVEIGLITTDRAKFLLKQKIRSRGSNYFHEEIKKETLELYQELERNYNSGL
jgi:hypothetical protein